MSKPALCEVCGKFPATHFCAACGKWLCDSKLCNLASAGRAVVQHPVRSAQVVGSGAAAAMRSILRR